MKMKDKKADQTVKRKKHLENLKKSRRDEPILDRNEPSKLEKPTILIVCEGKNTEPSYFRQFKLSTATIKPIGEGYNTVSLVNRAKQLSEERTYEQVWCVFDKDDFSNTDFNNAVQIAEANKFGVAYSNQAFEYWIILHFNDHQGGGMNRNDYDDKINELLKDFGITYDGKSSKIITDEIFELLEGIDTKINKVRRDLAIERAKKNYAFFDHTNYAEEESSTTVFKLVEELIKYI
jgi:hypothetical protein